MTKHIEIAERMAGLNPVPDPTVVDDSRLAALASLVEQRRSDVIETGPSASEIEPPVRGRRALAFASALVLVILVIGAVALLRGADTDDIVDEPSPTTVLTTTLAPPPTTAVAPDPTAAPTVTTTTTAVPVTPARLEMTWQQAPTQPAFGLDDELIAGLGPGTDVVLSVIEGGPGLIAVGGEFSNESRYQAVVWTSIDGIAWQRAAVPRFDDLLRDVALGPGGFVAVSEEWGSPGETVADEGGPRILVSADGESWTRVPQDEAAFPAEEAQLRAVTAGGPGYVAVGEVGGYYGGGQAAIWTSFDGVSWSRVEQALEEGYESGYVVDIVNTASGLVAVGHVCDTEDSCAPLVWTSTDGQVWDREVLSNETGQVDAVGAHGEGVVVVGHEGSPWSETAWFAADATGPFSSRPISGPPTQWPMDVISDGDRLLVLASSARAPSTPDRPMISRAVAWTSHDDGTAWYEGAVVASTVDGAFGNAIDQRPAGWRAATAFGDGFVAVGATGDGTAPVWIGTWNED